MKTVILIEDDAAIRESFTLILPASRINLISFDSGEKILHNELAAPDLFIIDENISGTNGIDLCRFVKSNAQYNKVPVILISASPNLAQLATENGADDFIEKPFRLKTLRAIIEKFVL